ncbi:Zn(2)-C6 fungal-type DNA-binding domain-containing protein [Pochonia chlamydosporia 170]|uniref:Zn(2)-C6 fungal-type DNA-binding domain-containing protein n=1 Tax=Pochonia chlamydosporia 170 TaxID=1380566 RepID=A0A179F3J8_METCM|nr:Zn(2)-C6 fungal-type DNA-binding domain-containing protein [Pochonia chlamydosporia 170]OAQ59699.1 Zn(2)-C6 fungal-type DNA-binding domain-containing protein [Pochonia chlamydosporia 170]
MSTDKRKRRNGNPSQNSEPATKRFQVPRACERCKSLRRGCEERRPCSRCIRAGVANDCTASSYPSITPSSPSGYGAPAEWAQVVEVAGSPVVTECSQLFFEHCYPTIPIVTPEYISRLQMDVAADQRSVEAAVLLVAFCAYVLLHVDEAASRPESAIPRDHKQYGTSLLDSASAVYRIYCWNLTPSLDACLLSFFLYAGQTRLSRHSQTFLFLRQTTGLWALVKDRQPASIDGKELFNRLFWVLLASERSHAIRYGRSITLHITPDTPDLDVLKEALPGLWSLAALFRPIDSAFMAIMNREAVFSPPSPEILDVTERAINAAIPPRFPFQDMQKANLRITKLWLRIVIWQLRLRLGYLTEAARQRNLTYQYPLDVARELVLSTRDLPIHAIKVHGVGLTEKLFDIASAVVDVMAGIPQAPRQRHTEVEGPPEDDLGYVRGLMVQLPGGQDVYDGLLERHLEQALHSPLQNQAVLSRTLDESPR